MASVRHYMPESPNLEKKATIGIMQAGGEGDIVLMGEGLGSELLMESAMKETEEENNGNVVFKWNIHGSAGK